MKYMKWFFCLLTVVLLSLVLLAGCASPDNPDSPDGDLDDTDLVIECDYGGEIARNREMIPILVRHDQEAIYLYYSDDFLTERKSTGCLTKPSFRRMSSTIQTGMSNGLTSIILPVTTTAICV